jgi:predicted double-glycine peptidase
MRYVLLFIALLLSVLSVEAQQSFYTNDLICTLTGNDRNSIQLEQQTLDATNRLITAQFKVINPSISNTFMRLITGQERKVYLDEVAMAGFELRKVRCRAVVDTNRMVVVHTRTDTGQIIKVEPYRKVEATIE